MNSSLLKKALPHIIAIAVFLILAIVYCKPAFDGKVVSQSDVVGWKGMAQQAIEYKEKNGHYPLWSESAFSGMPTYTFAMDATSKITIGYFFYILTFGLPAPVYYFFLACLSFYILLQAMRINPWVSIMAAIAYSYSTFDPIIINVGHNTQMLAIGYAPGIVAALLLIFQKRYLLGTAILAIFFGLQVGTQHLQIAYYTLIIMGFISIAYFIYSWQQKELKQFFISLVFAIIGGGLGFATYAVSMLPLQEYSKETKRGGKSALEHEKSDVNKTKGGLTKDYAFQWSYGIGETLTLIAPNVYGGGSAGRLISDNSKFAEKATEIGMPEDYAIQTANFNAYWGNQPGTAGPVYMGAVICFLFIFGLVYVKSWHKWWIIPAAILGIVLAWGKNFAAFNYFMFDYFPFYSKFRAPTQALFIAQLTFPVMAALGIDQLINSKESKDDLWKKYKNVLYVASAVLALLVVFYFAADYKSENDTRIKENFSSQISQSMARGKQPTPEIMQQAVQISSGLIKGLQADRQSIYGSDLIRTILLIALSAALLGAYFKGKIKELILIAGLGVLSSYDLVAEARKYLNEDNFVEPADAESSFAPNAADIQISKDPDKNFRVFDFADGNWSQDARASYHHNSIGGYSPAKLGLYQDIIDSQLVKGNINVLNMLNAKYFIQRNPANGQYQASMNPNAFGSCWLVKTIKFVNNGNEEMKALDSTDLRDTAIVDKQFENIVKAQPEYDSTATLVLLENRNDTVTYKYKAKTNQFAVFSEVYYEKGWNAYLDGQKAPYCKTDYILRGMPLPPGEHNIEFRFEPAIYKLGNTITLWSSIIVYLLLIGAIVAEWRKRKSPPIKTT